jgi:hypothetical protein
VRTIPQHLLDMYHALQPYFTDFALDK